MSYVELRLYGLALAAALALAACSSVAPPPAIAPAAAPVPQAAAALVAPQSGLAPISAQTQALFEQAVQAQREGRSADAERLLRGLAASHPELGGVHANLGLMRARAGRTAEAVAALERAVQASPGQARFHNELGIAYRANGQFEPARRAYESALALDPGFAAATLNLAILNDLYLGNSGQALVLYERYVRLALGGDPVVGKWLADLRNRQAAPVALSAQASPR